MKLTPYLHFNGNAEEAINFYKGILGGEVTISRYGDSPMPVDDQDKNKIIHARWLFDDNVVMISDSSRGIEIAMNGNIQLSVEVESEEKIKEVFQKMSEGGKVKMPLQMQFWGALFGMLEDKFGVGWMFNHEMEKL